MMTREMLPRILLVASEAVPLAKTGGLADVVGALPGALGNLGHKVAVVLPRYGTIDLKHAKRVYDSLPVWFGSDRYDTSIYRMAGEVPFFLVDCPPLYDREGYYGDSDGDYPDNAVRFAVLSRAALEVGRYIFRPDVIHCHDWQTGLVPVYLRTSFANDPTFISVSTLFTIHNLGYQGLSPKEVLPRIGLDETVFTPSGLEFFGKVSLIKGGLVYSDALNTVSKAYAREIQTEEEGFGLDGVLRARKDVLYGILNGVDYSEWNPETDPNIAARYSEADLSGKAVCKRDLMAEFGLGAEAFAEPLIGIVSRFTVQKGADLIAEVADRIADMGVRIVALGTGDADYEKLFLSLAERHPGRIAVRVDYDERLAHKIEAGADMFLMPSRYEPCGLNQIYSLRYGTVPIVRATGGLDDTIDVDTGFKFTDYSGAALLSALELARTVYRDRRDWEAMMRRGMKKDFSWKTSAAEYSSLYQRLASQIRLNP